MTPQAEKRAQYNTMTSQGEKRAQYRTMTAEDIVTSMSYTELRRNARKGGVMAIAELARREAEKLPQPTSELNIGV